MTDITVIAPAKINLILDVLYKRSDCYHELDGIMHTISIHDTVRVVVVEGFNVTVECNVELPSDNTVLNSAKLYMERAGISCGLNITLDKQIPSQSGLGGASADAAGVLMALHQIFGVIPTRSLSEMALQIGADVPFCLRFCDGGCARVQGVGEILTPLPTQQLNLVVVKCPDGISTKLLFESIDESKNLNTKRYKIDPALDAVRCHDTRALCKNLYNALEFPAVSYVPKISDVENMLLEHGALNVSMTGSGSAVFGVFDTKDAAQYAQDKISCTVAGLGYYVQACMTL